MDKNTVPEGFTMTLALVDALPVIFFGLAAIALGIKMNSLIFTIGAIICTVTGALKVLWKIIVVLAKKNVWPLFVQMRVCMPIGFIVMIVGLIVDWANIKSMGLASSFMSFPTNFCLIIWVLCMVIMIVLAKKLDSSDSKSNWIEQLVNGIGEVFLFVGVLFL